MSRGLQQLLREIACTGTRMQVCVCVCPTKKQAMYAILGRLFSPHRIDIAGLISPRPNMAMLEQELTKNATVYLHTGESLSRGLQNTA